MLLIPLLLLASGAASPAADPAKCDAKPFTLAKPAAKTPPAPDGKARPKMAKAAEPKPSLKPSCNHPGHGEPGHKH
jgi:hypothetical protein